MVKRIINTIIILLLTLSFTITACSHNQSQGEQASETVKAKAADFPKILVLPFLSTASSTKPDEEWPLFIFNMMHRELKRYKGVVLIPRKQVLDKFNKDKPLTMNVLAQISNAIKADYTVRGTYSELASGEFELNIFLLDKQKAETINTWKMQAESFFQLEQGWPIVEAAGKIAQYINGLSLVKLRNISSTKDFTVKLDKTSLERDPNGNLLFKLIPDSSAYLTVIWIQPDGKVAWPPPLLNKQVEKTKPVEITLVKEKFKANTYNKIHYLKIILSRNPLEVEDKASAMEIYQTLVELQASIWSEQTMKFSYKPQ